MRSLRFGLVISLILSFGQISSADTVTEWNEVTLQAIRVAASSPPVAARALAMVHVAIFDAMNAVTRGYRPYVVDTTVSLDTSREAAAAQAAYTVLTPLFPSQQAAFAAALEQSLAAIPDGLAKTSGVALGETVGASILTWRGNDGSAASIPYTPGTNPGDWQPTPPGFRPALLPQWPLVTPFTMTSGAQFRSLGPPSLQSAEYAVSLNEVKSLGALHSTTRTADQTHIALFWADGAATVTPPGHWNRIVQTIVATRQITLGENARLFALLNLGLADAAICAWDMKYLYNLWRPVTAIQKADLDNNPATEADPNWLPFLVTPPFPTYVSGHSTFSATAAEILARYFGTDHIAFTNVSEGVAGARSFTSFSEAAEEAGRSRIYGGIHYEFDNQDGLNGGRLVGGYAYEHCLQPTVMAAVAHWRQETANAALPKPQRRLLSEIVDNILTGLQVAEKQQTAGKATAARLRWQTTQRRISHYENVLTALVQRGEVTPEFAAALFTATTELHVELDRMLAALS